MSHIAHERQDNVSGIIVGGSYVAWQVFYGDRSQGGRNYSDTVEQAEADAIAAIDALRAEHCGPPCYLYPDSSLWIIKIWG